MKKLLSVLLVALLAIAVPASAQQAYSPRSDGPGSTSTPQAGNQVYVVQMVDNPVVAYEGGIPGYPATKPAKGRKINPNDGKVVRYAAFLDAKHNAALQRAGGGRKLYDYRYTFNGFAAELTAEQAANLVKVPGVVAVIKDEAQRLDTSSTPAFLGLADQGQGLWNQLGGVANAGEGVIVGIIDSGIWPENPSFSDRDADGKLIFHQIPGWHGKCTPGEDFPASKCNQKLIGAQWFNSGWGGDAAVKALFPYEYRSTRDADGHGSHTSSTAAGNYGVNAVVEGIDFGTISGMAPRARVAMYKVCWGKGDDGGCFPSDSVAAIDQAVADGVDVLNFSISGSQTNFMDPVEVAFLFAADAGVFVAASAGNSGPTSSTVAHNSPWLTTVAAGTHDRDYTATVTLGNGAVYSGASLGNALPATALLLAANAGLSGANPTEVALCYPGTLDPAQVGGKIVVCDRGVIGRTEKSLAVRDAGGAGMILANTSPSSINADLHFVPTIHVNAAEGTAIKAYMGGSPDPTAALSQGTRVTATAPTVASFSSRGPARAGAGNLLKPDIMAPGQDVLAAVAPPGYFGRNWDMLSGTSMSSPHVAGLAALMKHKYPAWSPAAIKSALMTTSSLTNNMGGVMAGNPFGYGAGHVAPNRATDPGLVYDAGWNDWLAFLCGTGQLTASYCPQIKINPSDLNYPSIAVGALAGKQTVKRTVTNVGMGVGTYTASVAAPSGISVTVEPSTLVVLPGKKANFTVTFTTNGAPLNAYQFGSLTWSDGAHSVRSPLVVRPVALAAPAEVSATGANGSADVAVSFGYTGAFAVAKAGLTSATLTPGTVSDDPDDDASTGTEGIWTVDVVIPAGVSYARFSLFDDFTDGNDDLDLNVYRGATLVGASGSGTSAEEVNLSNPTPATYTVVIHGYQTEGPDANFTLFHWLLSADEGNMTVTAPAAATTGSTGTVGVQWTGLTAGTKYLGSLTYSNGVTGLARTVLRVNP